MTIDDVCRQAADELRNSLPVQEPPRAEDRPGFRWVLPSIAATVVAVIIVGGLLLTNGSRLQSDTAVSDGPPGQTSSETTSTGASSQPIDLASDFVTLGGRTIRIEGTPPIALRQYQFFADFGSLGERHVVIVRADTASQVASHESAELDRSLGDASDIWVAARQGRPLFLSVDLGGWIAWLNVGNAQVPPSDSDLQVVQDRLVASASTTGVQLIDGAPSVHELVLVGSEDLVVTVRVGDCYAEMVPAASQESHPVRGSIIDATTYASWCDQLGTDLAEVIIEGPQELVQGATESLELTLVSDLGSNG